MKCYHTVASALPRLEIEDGQLIFTRDTRTIYLDINGSRLSYNVIQSIATEEERAAMLAPVEGYYVVESTGRLWRYKAGWHPLTPSEMEPIYFGTVDSFPAQGNPNRLYVTDDATYKYDAALGQYVVVANKTEWAALA